MRRDQGKIGTMSRERVQDHVTAETHHLYVSTTSFSATVSPDQDCASDADSSYEVQAETKHGRKH